MQQKIKLPPLGEGVTTATVLEWACEPGDDITVGQTLLSVELDKVDSDVPSPVAGTLVEQLVADGDEIEVGTVICTIDA